MNENLEFEYTVTKKAEGNYFTTRILVIIGYIVFGLTFFIGLSLLHLYQYIAFIVLAEWMLVFFTWRYVSVEYKYETESGAIRFYTIYGGKSKKLLLDRRIKSFVEIVPFSDEISKRSFDKEIFCLSSQKSNPDRYCAIYENQDGKECVVHFEATQKTLKILKFYNSSTVIADTRY